MQGERFEEQKSLPIDIYYNKLLEWLIDRRHCNSKWSEQVLTIREKINEAIQDMPAVDEIMQLLSGSYINYFHCVRIVELLEISESASKNIFGRYSSKRMKDWLEIKQLYETNNVGLAEASHMLIRNVNYEIPSLKRQIAKCQQTQRDCTRKESEYTLNANSFKEKYFLICKKMGIQGVNVRQELLLLLKELPDVYDDICRKVANCNDILDYYVAFVDFISPKKDEVERCCKDLCPFTCYVIKNGNTCVYQWRTGIIPTMIINPDVELVDDADNLESSGINWDVNVDEKMSKVQLPLIAFIIAPLVTNSRLTHVIDIFSCYGCLFILFRCRFFMYFVTQDAGNSTNSVGDNCNADNGDGETIDFGDEEKIDFGDEPAIDFGDEETIDFGDEPTIDFGDEQTIDFGDDSSEMKVEEGTASNGIAKGNDALTLLDYPQTRNCFVDEIMELQAFLQQRLKEMEDDTNILLSNQFQSSRDILQRQSRESVENMKKRVDDIVSVLTSVKIQNLFLIKASPRYVDRLTESLQHKLKLSQKMQESCKAVVKRKLEAAKTQSELEPKLEVIITKTKELQKEISQEISKKYDQRMVNIMGEVNSI
ncbi:CDK5 regulatory subunit-associated protein 3-like [Xenia sp. Carnegie-2017]|uniref:CDK5 regulatory subunit-associated protein 3-like n=1 Tax=Xenia sp. Carnegie-2017 TaxID=2897299 RepID=UPI001F04A5D6|nr:CDK5 regulatory subunit-associated protein 3-like [Xenia sp. Carnegie-2017]